MADIALVATVSRASLGLPALAINDHLSYALAPGFLGASVVWKRNQASSAYLDGDVTVNRTRSNVVEPVVVEVMGVNQVALQNAVNDLIGAFIQDSFELSVTIGGVQHTYYCESADYQMTWVGHRFIAKQLQVSFQVPRRPVPKIGVL